MSHCWQVGGAFGLRCSSERDVSAALSRHDRATLLVELLTTKPRPLGCAGSFRRARVSSSSSLPIAAGRQLNTLVGATPPDHTVPAHKGRESPWGVTPAQPHGTSPTDQVKPTSDTSQQSDHKNNTSSQLKSTEALMDHRGQSDPGPETNTRTKEVDQRLNERGGPERFEDIAAIPARLSVVVQKCNLAPQLKVFDDVLHTSRFCGHPQDDVVTVDPEKLQGSSSPQEEEEGEEKIIVWCVTGVCEAAGELSDSTHAGNNRNQSSTDNQEKPSRFSVPANHRSSAPQPANQKTAAVPIRSQPAPVVNHLSSSRRRPVGSVGANREEATGVSTNHRKETVGDQSTNDRSRTETSCSGTNEKTGAISAHVSKLSNRNLLPCKTRRAATANTASRPRPVRTLSRAEHQGMRRVVPISRTGPGAASADQHPEQDQQGSSGSEADLPRGQRPSTAPSSRRSSLTKTLDAKSSKDQKVTLDQNQDSKTRAAAGKAEVKPKVKPEEKMCRSTLRALRGGGSISAPATPAHKAPPSFAQSTVSSSFRRSTLAPSSSSLKTTASSVASSGSSLTRAGSPRVSHSLDLLRSQSIRPPPRSALQDPLAPTGTFSDKTSLRDSGRSTRPVWR